MSEARKGGGVPGNQLAMHLETTLRPLLSSYSRISERDHPLGMYTPAMVFVVTVRWKWKIGRDVRPEDTKSMAW